MSSATLTVSGSSVLVVGDSGITFKDMGVDAVLDIEQAESLFAEHAYSVLLVSATVSQEDAERVIQKAHAMNPLTQVVIQFDKNSKINLRKIITEQKVYKILDDSSEASIQGILFGAIEHHNELEQQENLHKLFNDQNEKLITLKEELEERIQKREKTLNKSKERLVIANHRIQAMHEALIALNKAASLSNMETQLNHSLSDAFALTWVRIVFAHQTDLIQTIEQSKDKKSFISVPLYINADLIGYCFFARAKEKKFTKDERDFLDQISETVAIAIDRISKKELSEKLRGQWETTFNAFSDPICITDSKFNIVQTNMAFQEQNRKKTRANTGINAFDVFFDDNTDYLKSKINEGPVEVRARGIKSDAPEFYQVSQHTVKLPNTYEQKNVLIFHNITKKKLLERQIIESSKLAELGTISSSIAHELNNPLGGMLNFLQLIQMDLDKDSPHTGDIEAMLSAGKKCKEIIENLLGFSRRTYFDIAENVKLRDLVENVLKLSQLQSKYSNIHIHIVESQKDVAINCDENQVAQAIRNVLQNSIEAIQSELERDSEYDGQIRIEIKTEDKNAVLTISDNGPGIDLSDQSLIINPLFTTKDQNLHSGLGLTIAHQILHQHGGQLEIFSQPMAGTSVKLSMIQSRFQGPETSF